MDCFTGDAGSGESEIRRYVLENDLLDAIVMMPDQMFYNTGIYTYIWVLNNDTTVDTDCLKSLLKACKPAALSVVAPLIRNHHDLSVWFAGKAWA